MEDSDATWLKRQMEKATTEYDELPKWMKEEIDRYASS